MSWHTSAIFISEDTPNDFGETLTDLGFPGGIPSGTTTFEEATSSMTGGKSVGHVKGWTVACDPMFFVSFDAAEPDDAPMQEGLWSRTLDAALRQKASGGNRVFGLMTEGASGTHGFTWYEDGDLRRALLIQAGQVIINHGDPLEVELQIEETDWEQRILLLMERLCVTFGELGNAEFQVFEYEGGFGMFE